MRTGIRRTLTIGIVSGLLVTPLALAHSHGGPGEPPPPPRGPGGPPPDPVMGPVGPALHALELSVEQRESIHEIVVGYVEGDLGPALQDFGESRRALELLTWSPDSSDQDLIDASVAVAEKAEQLTQIRRRLALDVLDVLTEDQRAALLQMLEDGPPPGRPDDTGGPPRRGVPQGAGR